MAHSTIDLMPPAPPPPANFHLMSYVLGLLTALSLVGGTLFVLRRPDPAPITLHPPPTAAPSATPSPSPTPLPTATPAPITIFISGAVRAPGLYQLLPDARVSNAIESAGGLTADADGAALNQAERLWDGAQIYVPSLNDTNNLANAPPVGISGEQPTPAPAPLLSNVPAGGAAGGQINLNTASLAELDSLPGIGAARAQAIIDNRPYTSVEELDKVSGIGPSMIEKLRPLVTVE